jgi:hypothetical protein
MHKSLFLPLALFVTASAASDADTPLQRCRVLGDDRARLACYDAIPAEGASSHTTQNAARNSDPAGFGLPNAAAPSEELRSRIAGHFDGWDARTVLRLENGQRWRIIDGSRTAYSLDRPQVRITRNIFGGYVMTVEGVAQTPRVRRVD